MAAGKDIEIDRLLMNNDRVGGSSRSHLETSLHMKASELEAASLALIEDKDRHRKPSHDVRHTFYGMFEKQEFRYDILQQEIAALPTIYNETGRNTRSAAGGHASKVRPARCICSAVHYKLCTACCLHTPHILHTLTSILAHSSTHSRHPGSPWSTP